MSCDTPPPGWEPPGGRKAAWERYGKWRRSSPSWVERPRPKLPHAAPGRVVQTTEIPRSDGVVSVEPAPEPPSLFSKVVSIEEWKWWSLSDSMFAGLPGMPPFRKHRDPTPKELAYWRSRAGRKPTEIRGQLLQFPRTGSDGGTRLHESSRSDTLA